MVAGTIITANTPAWGSTSNLGDPRASVLELEWRTPTGYERCAAVVTARRPEGLEATTAGHCALRPFSVVRFFDGQELYGSAVHVLHIAESVDAATLFISLDRRRSLATPMSVPRLTVPLLGSSLMVVGHPVSALRGPNEGRWTVTSARMAEAVISVLGAIEYEVYCSLCGPGDSGSGVFDGEGRLVGIVYGVTDITNVAAGRMPDGHYADVIPVAALR